MLVIGLGKEREDNVDMWKNASIQIWMNMEYTRLFRGFYIPLQMGKELEYAKS